jgi:membrane protease subunit (stomatin/prohibitin family)
MSQTRTKKKKNEEATFRASEEVKEVAEEDKEVNANTLDEAKEVGDIAPEEVKEVAGWNMSFCTNCGKGLDAESNFCPKCGVRTENGVKAGVAIPWTSDPHIRQELDVALQRASKAIDDGVKVVRETFREVASDVERGVKQARMSAPVKCQNCGQENTKFAKFCSRCGKELFA